MKGEKTLRINQKDLREQVKLCKVFHNVSYIYFAEQLEITKNSFYNWLYEQYNLSESKAEELEELVTEFLA